MKVLITGFTGQVGSQLAEFVRNTTNLDVIGLMRWQEDISNLHDLIQAVNSKDRVYIEYGDIADYSSLEKILAKHLPKYIFHLAAQSYPKTSFDSPIETLQTNIIGTANLLEAIRSTVNSRSGYDPVVHVCSSSEVYGKASTGKNLTEQTPLHGASPYSISKIGTDFLGQFYGEAYGIKTFVTRMGTHSGKRRSDVFFESTVAKQIALIEAGLIAPVIKVGNLNSIRTFQDTRDAIRAYWLLSQEMDKGAIKPGEVFNIAGVEKYKLTEVIDILLKLSNRNDITIEQVEERMRPIDADYQMFDNTKIRQYIDWRPEIKVVDMFQDLLDHWREQILQGKIPLDR